MIGSMPNCPRFKNTGAVRVATYTQSPLVSVGLAANTAAVPYIAQIIRAGRREPICYGAEVGEIFLLIVCVILVLLPTRYDPAILWKERNEKKQEEKRRKNNGRS